MFINNTDIWFFVVNKILYMLCAQKVII